LQTDRVMLHVTADKLYQMWMLSVIKLQQSNLVDNTLQGVITRSSVTTKGPHDTPYHVLTTPIRGSLSSQG